MMNKKIKILLAKPGLDGHDEGVKIVARALIDAGFDVVYSGLRKSVEEIAMMANTQQVDVIGLSILSGSHLPICESFRHLRKEHHLEEKLWLVGGNIPAKDTDALKNIGVDAVLPFGTSLQAIVYFLQKYAAENPQ